MADDGEPSITDDWLEGRAGLDGVVGRAGALSPKANVRSDSFGADGIGLEVWIAEDGADGTVDGSNAGPRDGWLCATC